MISMLTFLNIMSFFIFMSTRWSCWVAFKDNSHPSCVFRAGVNCKMLFLHQMITTMSVNINLCVSVVLSYKPKDLQFEIKVSSHDTWIEVEFLLLFEHQHTSLHSQFYDWVSGKQNNEELSEIALYSISLFANNYELSNH